MTVGIHNLCLGSLGDIPWFRLSPHVAFAVCLTYITALAASVSIIKVRLDKKDWQRKKIFTFLSLIFDFLIFEIFAVRRMSLVSFV